MSLSMIDPMRFRTAMEEIRRRTHNQGEEAVKAAVQEWIEGAFSEFEGTVRRFRRGPEIFDARLPFAEEGGLAAFSTVSLGNWMEVAAVAGVPAIQADFLGCLPLTPLLGMADPGDLEAASRNETFKKVAADIEAIVSKVPDGHILRMDAAGGAELKMAMAEGSMDPLAARPRARGFIEHEGKRFMDLDDPRFFEILMSYPEDAVPMWSRPWMQAKRRAGTNQWGEPGSFPREWRVFIAESRIVGISNYYPQSPMTIRELDVEVINAVTSRAISMIGAMKAGRVRPFHPTYTKEVAPNDICCSLDFMEAEDGRLLFLEGGPGHLSFWGASGCCFGEKSPIRGVALAAGKPPTMQAAFPIELEHFPEIAVMMKARVAKRAEDIAQMMDLAEQVRGAAKEEKSEMAIA